MSPVDLSSPTPAGMSSSWQAYFESLFSLSDVELADDLHATATNPGWCLEVTLAIALEFPVPRARVHLVEPRMQPVTE